MLHFCKKKIRYYIEIWALNNYNFQAQIFLTMEDKKNPRAEKDTFKRIYSHQLEQVIRIYRN